MTLPGIDVSSHQAVTPPLAAESFLIARATYGTSPDSMYQKHTAMARSHGIVVGAYHFGRNMDVGQQVTAFLNEAGSPDLFALDLEGDGQNVGMTNAQAAAFIAAVQKTGRKCGLYHSTSGYPSLGQDWRWVADYRGAAPPIPWDFWQYQGSPLDRDTFHGDAAALAALVGGTGSGPNVLGDAPMEWSNHTPVLIDIPTGTQLTDENDAPLWKTTVAQIGVPSPFQLEINPTRHVQAIFVTGAKGNVVAFVHDYVNLRPVPVPPPDCTTEVAAAVAPLNARIAAAKTALG